MIRISTFCFLLAMSLWCDIATAQFLNWQYSDLLTDQRQSGAAPDMVVAQNGDFHLAYWDQHHDRLIYGLRTKVGGKWVFTEVDPTHDAGYRPAITIDPNGFVHIAYYENTNGLSYLRYATNISGSWVNEGVVQDTTLGKYGPDFLHDSYVELSLDISFDNIGQPVISFFDGSVFDTSPCGVRVPFSGNIPDIYTLDLNIAHRQGNGTWDITDLDYRNRNMPNCIDEEQDRFGEFCRLLPQGDSLLMVTNALFSHELLLLSASASDPTNWRTYAIDSVARVVNQAIMYEEGFHFSDAKLIGDTVLHLAYGLSEAYGLDYTTSGNNRQGIFRTSFYTRIALDSLGKGNYAPYHYEFSPLPRDGIHRTYFALDAVGNDSIYLAYFDTQAGEVVMTYSEDKGENWQADTIWQDVITNTRLLCTVYSDSVFISYYASDRDELVMASRHRAGGSWRYERVTHTEERGRYLTAKVDRPMTGPDRLHIVFDEKQEDQLYYGTQASGTWQYEPVGPSGERVKTPSLDLERAGNPLVAYSLAKSGALGFSRFDGNNWQTEVIDSLGPTDSPVLTTVGDSIHICYLDLGTGTVKYAHALLGSGNWIIEEVDRNINGAFSLPTMKADSLGRLHLAYKQIDGTRLKYARRELGKWTTSFITDSLAFNPAHIDLKIRKKEALPTVAFQDGINNEILMAEQSTLGFWGIRSVLKAQGSFIGNPLSLLLADGDTRWMLYNYVTSTSEVRLIRQHRWTREWLPVTVNNNIGEIAGTFEFLLAGDDFYLIGRKNAIDDEGIAMLYSAAGATTEIDPLLAGIEPFTLTPNPSHTTCTVSFSLPNTQTVAVTIWNIHAQRQPLFIPPKTLPPGSHMIEVNTSELPSGIYMCKVQIGEITQVKKLVVYH